ncbi:MFS transporter [Corynebacterium sp.]|uniref:MFS transporter n=1 Tax=Corynebacterium sp. TaxID=1720 RepID=UPI0026DC859B|nr:MFS transporter [Corynebacterium sp.]MDO5031434.1 MFS transporter [Corynebacterium sp.]
MANKNSVWKVPGFTETMVAVAASFGAWSILLPVVPLAVLDAGGSPTVAGATTGVFMVATVITQILTPNLLRKVGYRPVMAGSALMLGVPALGHMLGDDAVVALTFSALRGVGFGALTVAESALVAEITPTRLLGKATGYIGLFVGAAQMAFLPFGLWLAGAAGYNTTYISAAALGILGFVMCLRVPSLKAAPVGTEETSQGPRVPMWKLFVVPALALTSFSITYGLASNFLSPAVRELDPVRGAVLGGLMLSIIGGTAMVTRFGAGVVADRIGRPGTLMIPSQIFCAFGVGLIALALAQEWSVWWLVLGTVMYGAAFGVVQNEALLSMFDRLPRERLSEGSAIWNIFYDGGTGLGSTLLGMVVASSGYSGAFAVGTAIIVVGLAMTTLDHVLGRTRVSETNDIRTRLRRLRKV